MAISPRLLGQLMHVRGQGRRVLDSTARGVRRICAPRRHNLPRTRLDGRHRASPALDLKETILSFPWHLAPAGLRSKGRHSCSKPLFANGIPRPFDFKTALICSEVREENEE